MSYYTLLWADGCRDFDDDAILKTLMLIEKQKQTGFTIVELLIVIVVIGILAAITVVAYNGVQERANVQKANSDLATFVKAVRVARLNESKTMREITGSGCTYCGDQARYELTLDRIGAASGTNLSSLKAGDPWGNKYVIDENEGESSTDPCRRDGLGVTGSSTHPGLIIPIIPMYNCL